MITFTSKAGNTFQIILKMIEVQNPYSLYGSREKIAFDILLPKEYQNPCKEFLEGTITYISDGYDLKYNKAFLDEDLLDYLKFFLRRNESSLYFISQQSKESKDWIITFNQTEFILIENKLSKSAYVYYASYRYGILSMSHRNTYTIPQDVKNFILQAAKYKSFIG